MSLILHLMKKDARYLRYEVAIWLLLVAAQAGLVLSGVDTRAPAQALSTIGNLYGMLLMLQLVIGGVFAAQLVQCDPLVGTTAFWRTQPISRRMLLAAKLASLAIVLLGVPFVVELATYVALGLAAGDSLSAAWSGLMLRSVLLAPAVAVAVITPDIPRFVVSLILLVVGATVVRWVVMRSGLEALTIGLDTLTPTLDQSRFVVFCGLAVACGLVVAIHQYLSLKTIRSTVLIPPAVILCVLAIGAWRIDFLGRPEREVDRARVDPDAITLSLDPTPLESGAIARGSGTSRVTDVRLFRRLVASATPGGTFVLATAIRSSLKLADGIELKSDLHTAESLGSRWGRAERTDRQRAMLSVLGPLEWSNLGTVTDIEPAPALVEVPEDVFHAHEGMAGTLTAEVDLTAYAFEITGTMPVRPGGSYRHGPKAAEVASVRFRQDGAEVTLREVSVAGPWRLSLWSSSGQYLLLNRTRREALFPDSESGWQVLSGNSISPAQASLIIGRRVLTFGIRSASRRSAIDAAWLAQAEIIRVERISLGAFTKRLTVDRFLLEPVPAR